MANYTTWALPYILLAPEIFEGKLDFGKAARAQFAFRVLQRSLQIPLQKLPKIASLTTLTKRVYSVLVTCDEIDKSEHNLHVTVFKF